jgi:hypothetical protein
MPSAIVLRTKGAHRNKMVDFPENDQDQKSSAGRA